MGCVISFSDKNEEVWGVIAGWGFRQLLDDVTVNYPDDAEMVEVFAEAEAIGDLQIYRLESELAARIANNIWRVATGIILGAIRSGIHDHPYGDARRVEQYQVALQELLDIFPATWKEEKPSADGRKVISP